MHNNTANKIVTKEPASLLEILVYHSGKYKYTETSNNNMGTENINAIGRPRSSLLVKLLCAVRLVCQYSMNESSFSDNMLQN